MDGFQRAQVLGWVVGAAVALLVLVEGWWFVLDAPPWRSRLRHAVGVAGRVLLILVFAPIAGVVLGLAAFVAALTLGSL